MPSCVFCACPSWLKPFKPEHEHASSPHCSSYVPYGMVLLERSIVLTYNISSLVIISVILMTCLFDQPMSMFGEIGSVSLLGLKELKETETTAVQARYCSKCRCPCSALSGLLLVLLKNAHFSGVLIVLS